MNCDIKILKFCVNKTLEKEKVKKLIDHAMKGLEESGRIGSIEMNETKNDSNINSSINDIESTLNK